MARADNSDYDLLIIGTGGAGTAAAIRGAELGARVAIAEGAVVGGTCVNVGCIPSKLLLEAAAQFHAVRTSFPGLAREASGAWRRAQASKGAVVERLRQEKYLDVLAGYEGVTLLRGEATLLGAGRARVGEAVVGARRVVLATGALTSTSAMELAALPASLIVLGAGAVGLELGQAFARFGVRVSVLEAEAHLLPGEDPELSRALADALVAEGLELRPGARVTRVERGPAGYRLEVEQDGKSETLPAEQLLVAAGRRPNTAGLGLEGAGVEVDARGFVRVDGFMRTSNPGVFAAGDVTGAPQFVYLAAAAGRVAAEAALADLTGAPSVPLDASVVPRVTFTDPQLAAVGLTEAQARAAGHAVQVATLPAAAIPRAAVTGSDRGLIKLVADVAGGRLLGAHLLTANAGDVIGEATLALRFGLTSADLASTLHPYLTWAEGVKLAAQAFTQDVTRLSCCA